MSGLRIAATRAGHQNGDGHDGNGAVPATEGGRRLADAPPEVAHRVRRRGSNKPEKRGEPAKSAKPSRPPKAAKDASPPKAAKAASAPKAAKAAPAPVPVKAATPGTGRPASKDRAKVLRQRRRRRRLLIAFTAFMAFCTLFVGLGYVYVQRKLGQITRLELPALADDLPGAVMNVLLVGSDSRANLAGDDAKGFGQDVVSGQRSDTIMLLHVDPAAQRAAIVSVPRDLYVPIANTNRSDRVNAAFAIGGPDQLVATIQRTLGITIHHYVQVDFSGFKDIVDTVGGVTMYVPYPVRDSGSGLDLGRAGCWELDGNKGLSWVRSRNMEFLINGTWQADGRGDLGRIERQQDFIRRMMKKALSSGIQNPLTLNRLIGVGVRDVSFDTALSTKDLTALGRRFSSLDPDKVVLRTLPTDPADIDGKSVLKLQTAQAQSMIDLLNGKTTVDGAPTSTVPPAPTTTAPPSNVKPADVRVRVLNGAGTAGLATRTATAYTGAGYVVVDKGDAPSPAPKTTISYATGQLAKAQSIQGTLAGPAVLKEDATLKSADVNLLLGADFTGLKAGVGGAASTTLAPTTTAPPQINPVPLPKGTTTPPC